MMATTAEGFFVGLSFPEVGAGSLDIGMGTTGNFKMEILSTTSTKLHMLIQ